ncbi:pilus assembly PilX family protein [Undibacterium sp. TC9W]|uniref:pilus assembly PilX family protein n=1 Tax=Undibacterium sp. TC9W TaxID=3413053 RepID=UPI003BF2A822
MRKLHSAQRGFVMLTSMIFLMVLTMLAITAVRRATQEERFARSIREQNIAFQAAETALRYCQKNFELTNKGDVLPAGLDKLVGNIPVNQYSQGGDPSNPPPTLWSVRSNWATKGFRLPAGTVANLDAGQQPECMVEAWYKPLLTGNFSGGSSSGQGGGNLGSQYAYVFTARGQGTSNLSVIWLQVVLYIGAGN